jgi:hypothetical protein
VGDESLAQRAAGAVVDDQVARAHLLVPAVGAALQSGVDGVGRRSELDAIPAKARPGAVPLRVAFENGLEHVLVAGGRRGGARLARVGPGRAAPDELGIRQAPAASDAAALLIAGALLADFRLEPELAKDLHAAGRDAGELVLDRRGLGALGHETVDAVVGEQRGRG